MTAGGDGERDRALDRAFERLGQLLEFPTDFPLKIMGTRVDGFAQAIAGVVLAHAPDFDVGTMQMRASARGTYLSVTVTIRARSREQLQALYTELAGHPLVRVVL